MTGEPKLKFDSGEYNRKVKTFRWDSELILYTPSIPSVIDSLYKGRALG